MGQNSSPSKIQSYTALFKEFRDIFVWTYEEIPGIISLLLMISGLGPGTKPVCKKLRQVHPRKAAAIKEEVEKLLKAGFIYPVPLTEWVSNIVPANKK